MSQMCEYCDDEHDVRDTVFAITSHGFGHANKEHKPFCSVECRVWWRRRCSNDPGDWEQPIKPGHQIRLDRFTDTDFPGECTLGKIELGPDDEAETDQPASESGSATVAARPTSESTTGQEVRA